MKYLRHERGLWQQVRSFPLAWLQLTVRTQLLLVTGSYGSGIIGLLLLFPPTHNGSTMFLPIVCACWLFRYRGLLVSLILNGLIFQLAYLLFWKGMLPDKAFIGGGIIGFGSSLGLGVVICWLRTAVDHMQKAQQQARSADQERLHMILKERQTTLAFEQQRKMNALKDQFLLNVNHELRTPLTHLGGSLELIRDFDERLDALKRTQILNEALESLDELVRLVDRVLDATKVMSDIPEARMEAVKVGEFLQELLAHLSPQDLASYTLEIKIPEQITVRADPQFLRQILRNLLSNIFKYVPRQTRIHIETTRLAPSSLVCISVQDQGPGIPREEMPLLFEKFVRLKRDLATSTSGSGLGLYISKQLVEAMGGHIWVESSGHAGEGSRFCILLPLVPAP